MRARSSTRRIKVDEVIDHGDRFEVRDGVVWDLNGDQGSLFKEKELHRTVPCPKCGVRVGAKCKHTGRGSTDLNRRGISHTERIKAFRKRGRPC